jgi:trigger factor
MLEIEELKVTVESPAAWARRIRITVPAEQLARERKEAVVRLAKKARLPGFRQGKVPPQLMERRFGAAIEQETLERVMGEAYRQVIRREGLQPITDGSIDNVQYQSGEDLTFDVGFEVRPQVDLNRLGGFMVRKPSIEIDDAQVDRVLEGLRDQNAVWSPIEGRPPENGEMAAVEITRLDDDAGAPARRYEVILGEGQAAASIEDVIRTLTPGEENDFTVQLAEHAEDPAGATKAHTIHLKLLEAKQAEKPAVDDAFARSLGDFEDLGALRTRIREDLVHEAEHEGERALRHHLASQIVDANPLDVPSSMVNESLRRLVPEREGADPQQVAEARERVRPAAEFAIRRMLIVEKVAEMESLAVSEAELDARVAQIAERAGRNAAEVKGLLRKDGRLAELAQEITEDKVFGYLKSLSTIE